jgi:hypothetical protein
MCYALLRFSKHLLKPICCACFLIEVEEVIASQHCAAERVAPVYLAEVPMAANGLALAIQESPLVC